LERLGGSGDGATLVRRLAQLPQGGVLLADEAHHMGAASWQKVKEALAPELLQATTRLAEAEPLLARATRIFLASRGMNHPHTQKVKGNYLKILQAQGLPEAEIQLKLDALDGSGIG
jgi:hypothetical protein